MIRIDHDEDIEKVKSNADLDAVSRLVAYLHLLAGRGVEYFSRYEYRTAMETEHEEPASVPDGTRCERCNQLDTAVASQAYLLRGLGVELREDVRLSYEQLNELLLLVDESRISEAFFQFFFLSAPEDGPGKRIASKVRDADGSSPAARRAITVDELTHGISRFRAFAMLKYGNFRFGYRKLRKLESVDELRHELHSWTLDSETLKDHFELRPAPVLGLSELGQSETRFLGKVLRDAESRAIEELRAQGNVEDAKKRQRAVDLATEKGLKNAHAYMASDYLDIYFATSMRYEWDFTDTYEFIRAVFSNPDLEDLAPKIRYFDPTQSDLPGIIEKGLLEALMLRRARCTVYLARDTETLGKDSELAATLAQGKPVVVFVRELQGDELRKHRRTIGDSRRPAEYVVRRAHSVMADRLLDGTEFVGTVRQRLEELGRPMPEAKLRAEVAGLAAGPEEAPSDKALDIVAALDAGVFDRRAKILRKFHPLAMQVDLETGVGNGVLVVRSAPACAGLVRKLLLNELNFSIEAGMGESEDVRQGTVLREHESGCVFRYVTADKILTNSFWNYYLLDSWISFQNRPAHFTLGGENAQSGSAAS